MLFGAKARLQPSPERFRGDARLSIRGETLKRFHGILRLCCAPLRTTVICNTAGALGAACRLEEHFRFESLAHSRRTPFGPRPPRAQQSAIRRETKSGSR